MSNNILPNGVAITEIPLALLNSAESIEAFKQRVRRSDIRSFCNYYKLFEVPGRSAEYDCGVLATYYYFKADLKLKYLTNGTMQVFANASTSPIGIYRIINYLTDLYVAAHNAAGDHAVRPLNSEDLAILYCFTIKNIRKTLNNLERMSRQNFQRAYADWLCGR